MAMIPKVENPDLAFNSSLYVWGGGVVVVVVVVVREYLR